MRSQMGAQQLKSNCNSGARGYQSKIVLSSFVLSPMTSTTPQITRDIYVMLGHLMTRTSDVMTLNQEELKYLGSGTALLVESLKPS
jgi:hypothetical protein